MKLKNLFILFTLFVMVPYETFGASTENGMSARLREYCQQLDGAFKKHGWGASRCEEFLWYHHRDSVLGTPITWTVFGDASDEEAASFKTKDVTIVMCGVHGDEITPVKFCYDLMYYLKEKFNNPVNLIPGGEFHNKVVLVSPLVNPDSFFSKKLTRTNAKGIDPNRNFPTKDWASEARQIWINKYNKDKRRNPGERANSEPEVVFQVNLINRYKPDKIVSVHAPLTLLDYDGPTIAADNGMDGKKAQDLLHKLSEDAKGYNIKDYPFFPGSLGNWAGQERSIPTYTLELPSSDARKNKEYWELFKFPMHRLITHSLRVAGEKNAPKASDSSELVKSEDFKPVN